MFLTRQLKSYFNEDPDTKHEKCLPISVFQTIWHSPILHIHKAYRELICGALYFACRSCEYTKTEGRRKTKLLTIRDIRFFYNNIEIPKTGSKRYLILHATAVTITFVRTKTDQKDTPITQHRSGTDICPVLAWGSLVYRIMSYKDSHLDLAVNTFKQTDRTPFHFITQKEILLHIRSTVLAIGKRKLGFSPDEVGTHSIRSSFAMQLYLQKVSVYTIMLQGRWKSDCFLLYIRKQVMEFGKDISNKIAHAKEEFYTIPN